MQPIQQAIQKTQEWAAPALRLPHGARILIVSQDDSITEWLTASFRDLAVPLETAKTMKAACELAKSGEFQVVITTPLLSDGSWKRLIDLAGHYELGFEVILLARNFDLLEWTEALKDGAFDVLDLLHDLPKAAEVVKHALWAAYLRGAGPCPETAAAERVGLSL